MASKKAVSVALPNEKVIRRKWNRKQSDFLQCTDRLIDFEGGVRSGKTTAMVWALINLAVEYPGIKMLLARWTGDALNMQLKPKFYEECPPELLGKWNTKEEYQEFTNGSMLYIRSLKSSDDKARFAKFTGLTLGVIAVDQPEELPRDIYYALIGRLSQIGFPQRMFLAPNPPAQNHWLVDEFPEENNIPGHRYIFTSLYDNRGIIGDEYILELERQYPIGHAMRRRMIDGKRGMSIEGDAVYGRVFTRDMHVREIEYMPDYPVYESWDFGQRHPAVSWHQLLPWGHWNVLGEYMGKAQFIDETVPIVAALRNELFPGLTTLRVCCDPAGVQGQGARHTCVEVLNQHLRMIYGPAIGAIYKTNSNRPEQRQWCVQQISTHMSRLIKGRPALVVHPRAERIADGFEAGYVYDDRMNSNSSLPNFRKPKKDGYYDHLMNTCEYFMLNYGAAPVESVDNSRLTTRQRLHQLQQDHDDADTRGRTHGRTGY